MKPQSSAVSRFHRLPVVEEITGLKKTQIFEHIARGEFPAPVKLTKSGRAIAWDEEELLRWRAERLAARRCHAG